MLPNVSEVDVVNQLKVDEMVVRVKDGISLMQRLFDIYLEETPRLLGELRKGLDSRDEKLIYETIHQLKGSAAAMGAARVFTITEAALELCGEGTILDVEDLLGTIEGETNLYIRDVAKLLNS